jgi:hypothetical protein
MGSSLMTTRSRVYRRGGARLGALVVALAAAGVVGAATFACSSDSSSPSSSADAGADAALGGGGPDAAASICGHPGDEGNSLGVGKFCQYSSDCEGNSRAKLCAIIGDDTAFFCTFLCDADGGPDQCGENARCACNGGPCGCFPLACDEGGDAGAGADAGGDGADAAADAADGGDAG